jgi:hypothetical protein
VSLDPRRLWAVDLDPADRSVLDAAFRQDPELGVDVGYALAGLVELGVEEIFVRALVRRLRETPAIVPALAVLPAADEALTEAGWPL